MDRFGGHARSTSVDPTIRRIAVLFRVLGWVWMGILVALGLVSDPDQVSAIGRPQVAILAFSVATIWTGLTIVLARTEHFYEAWFIVVDLLIALLIGAASLYAETDELFHGGYPMSWVLVAAASGGFRWAFPGSILLFVEQFWVRLTLGKTVSGAAFAIVFPLIAVVAGWGLDAIRDQSRARTAAERRLAESEAAKARLEERANLANRLHDSVLQTLLAIRMSSGDQGKVNYLARRQERELKRMIEQFRSPYEESFRVALLAARDELEDLHDVRVEAHIRVDMPLDIARREVVAAAREAMINAAKHSGDDSLDLYAELEEDVLLVIVRDRGTGFAPGEALGGDGYGLSQSIIANVEKVGGRVAIRSSPGHGTEVTITLPSDAG